MDIQRKNLADFTFKQTYAKYVSSKKRRENWGEAVSRMMDMHATKLIDKIEVYEDLNEIEDAIVNKDILGSQRALQFGGRAILEKNWRIFNCTTSYCDRPRFFAEALWLLLCGCGVGYSIQKHHVKKLPPVISANEVNNAKMQVHLVKDTIEGWADALHALIEFYLGLSDTMPIFNFSQVRKRGSALSHGGKAPGPIPLKMSLQKIEAILFNCAGRSLRPIDCNDIICHAADCVLSGGVRRSATIALFSIDDDEMWKSKTGNWWATNPQRARANISAVFIKNTVDKETFKKKFLEYVPQWGEPGIIFAESTEFCFNPCVSGRTKILTNEGYKTAKELYESQKQTDLRIDPRFGKGTYSKTTEKGVFLTGVQDVYKVKTKQGYSIECTKEHRIMTARGWIEAQDLLEGDQIHIFNNSESPTAIKNHAEFDKGLIAGWWSGDGTIVDEKTMRLYMYGEKKECTKRFEEITNCTAKYSEDRDYLVLPKEYLGIISKEDRKKIPSFIWNSSIDTKRGYLQGLFSSDGSIQGDTSKKGVSIRLSQNNLEFLYDVQMLLLEFGIFCTIYKNRRPAQKTRFPDGHGDYKEYDVKAVHELMISKENINWFYHNIRFCLSSKQTRLEEILINRKRGANKQKFVATFESMEFVGKEEVFDLTEDLTHSFVANGVVVHNCVEISMCPVLIKDKNGAVVKEYGQDLLNIDKREEYEDAGFTFESGWQACNLTEVNASKFKAFDTENIDYMYNAVKQATKLGTIQASYTKADYLGEVSQLIVEREALLGVSLTGLANSAFFHSDKRQEASDLLRDLAQFACDVNKDFAGKIGINPASRITCVKPSGTASVVLGCASGIHPEHAQRFIRSVQVPADSQLVQKYMESNPFAVVDSVWSANKTDKCIQFAVECDQDDLFKNDVNAIDFLGLVKMVFDSWVKNGNANPSSLYQANHNVSNTCIVRPTEWEDLSDFIFINQDYFCGISFIGASGDYDYMQPPFKAVYSLEERAKMYATALYEAEKKAANQEELDAIIKQLDQRNKEYIEAFDLFMKLRESNQIDFDSVIEHDDQTEQAKEVACAGGACLV